MLKDIAGIKIRGANFESDTSLKLFDPVDGNKTKNVKGTLLYGRNGAGKSTIAKAIRTITGTTGLPIIGASFFDEQGKTITLSEEDKMHIFVFDEDYVNSKVRVMKSGLGSIVMLGEQADLTAQIEEATKAYNIAKTGFEQTETEYKQYENTTDEKAPGFYLNKMNLSLSGNRNWAGRDRDIHGNRRNASVNNSTYERFVNLSPEMTHDELILEYDKKKKELEDAKNGDAKLNVTITLPPATLLSYKIEEVAELLKETIQKPELSEREQYLLSLVQTGKSELLQKRAELFRKSEISYCPYCLQDVTPEYKKELISRIEKVLSKAVEEHQAALRGVLLNTYDMAGIVGLSALTSYKSCVEAIDELNNAITKNNELIQAKIDDPYTTPGGNLINVVILSRKVDKLLKQLSSEQTEYNKRIADTRPVVGALEKINSELAYYEIADDYRKYLNQKKEAETAKKKYDDAKSEVILKRQHVRDLEAKRANIRIASDVLNRSLKYIFFSDDRLSIELEEDHYKLLSKGKPVKPCDVSVGERNILGLCYFFASMFEGKEEQQAYREEHLIVIDDPISSYDFENRVGILSFIKYELSRFLTGNSDSRALVLTHDLNTFFNTEKVFDEILKCFDKTYKFNIYELQSKSLKAFQYKSRQEYTELLNIIFSYAKGDAAEFDLAIGNIMRQALEAFSTFTYKKGIVEVSTDQMILNEIEEAYRDYFENLMYRLVLNGGSHRDEQARNLEVDFYSTISEQEKRRTAKDILCFIYSLNQRHILSHLPENADNVIEGWLSQIAQQQK